MNFKKYYKITTNINVVVQDDESDELVIAKLKNAFASLIPCYDAIFGDAPKSDIPKREKWIIPCDYKQYDIIKAFAKYKELDWHATPQTKNLQNGDKVYIYVGKPFSRIMYECEVVKTGLLNRGIDDSEFIRISKENWSGECFRIRLISKFEGLSLSLDDLNANGLDGNVQAARKLSTQAKTYIEKNAKASDSTQAINDEEMGQ